MSSSSSASLYSIEKLDGTNFSSWKFRLKMVLIDRNLWDIVDGTESRPGPEDLTALGSFTKKDNQALAQIALTVSNAQLVHIRNASSARDAWLKLCSAFEAKGLAAKVYLRRQFFTVKLHEGSSMQSHINMVRDLADQLDEIGAPVSDEDLAITLLCSLPERFDSLIVSLESRPSKELTSDFVINRLLSEERRQSEITQSNVVAQAAHQVRVASKLTCSFCKRPNHTEATCYRKNGYPAGHPRSGQASAQAASTSTQASNTTAMNYSAVSVCCLSNAASSSSTSTLDWLIDSGASTHICAQRSCFSSLRPLDQPVQINIADGRAVRALGIGDIALDVLCGTEWISNIFKDVLFAPDLKMNLLSVSRLTNDGLVVSFFDDHCHIMMQDRLVASSIKEASDLYRLISRIDRSTKVASAAISSGNAKLWHARLGHLNAKSMLQLSNKQMVDGLPALRSDLDLRVCEGCALGKSHRVAMPQQATTRATQLLELVHSDICGPMQVNSLGGKKYFITFIDDFSRVMVVRTIAKKSEAFESFLTFKAWAENLTGHRIKKFRSDGGGEYCSRQFDALLKQQGIARQRTPPYTPEHNGVAERANRTLVEMARSMLHASGLDFSFWGEAVICAAYLRNRCPTSAVPSNRTPFEVWTGKKPNLEHLRTFGCKAFVHIPDQKRPKLDAKSFPCVFIGYSDESKAYRFYDPETRCVIVSRDAIFDEGSSHYSHSHSTDRLVEWENSIIPSPSEVIVPSHSVDVPVQRNDRADAIVIDDDSDDHSDHSDQLDHSDDEDRAVIDDEPSSSHSSYSDDNVPLVAPVPSHDASIRRSARQRIPPVPYWDVKASERQLSRIRQSSNQQALLAAGQQFVSKEPAHFKQVVNRADHQQWEDAMQAEYDSIQRTGTWSLVPLPAGRKAIGCRWVYKLKHKADGSIDRYKARLVAQGFSQKEGVDFNETFAPVAKFSSIRALLWQLIKISRFTRWTSTLHSSTVISTKKSS
jgi:transposase InsO family protein